jgi:hypothetical protein
MKTLFTPKFSFYLVLVLLYAVSTANAQDDYQRSPDVYQRRPEREQRQKPQNPSQPQRSDDGTQYLFGGNGSVKVSGFGGLIMEVGEFNNSSGFSMGGGGGVLFNKSVFIGGYGQGLLNGERTTLPFLVNSNIEDRRTQLMFGHSGIWVGASPNPKSAVHLILDMKIGWGSVRRAVVNDNGWDDDDWDKDRNKDIDRQEPRANVFVLTPQAGLEANLTKWMRISVQGGYRFVNSYRLRSNFDLSNGDLSGAFGVMTLKFGGF